MMPLSDAFPYIRSMGWDQKKGERGKGKAEKIFSFALCPAIQQRLSP
jgi:hypothetical protein